MSKSNDIAEAIAASLRKIRLANGCSADAGARVYRGRRAIEEKDTPCLVLFRQKTEPGNDPPKESPYTVNARINYVVEGAAKCDPDNPDVAGEALLADIMRAAFTESPELDSLLVVPITYAGDTILPREHGQNFVTVQVHLDALYSLTPATP